MRGIFRLVLAAASAMAASAAAAETHVVPVHPYHAVNPSLSLSRPARNPVEQQVQQNYRTALMQAQRELLQANPSGTGRVQLEIGRALNQYDPVPR